MTRDVEGFILAAGLGTRMGALSRVLPKPAWPLAGRPLLQWGAGDMRASGIARIACNAHHLASRLKEAATWGPALLQVFDEPVLLGSAGGLRHVLGHAADPLAVWNGDALAEVPWGAFLEAHRHSRAQLSWLLVPHDGGPWNPVWLDPRGCILPPGETGEGPFHFTGAALWGPEALVMAAGESSVDTKRDVLPRLSRHHGVVVAPFPWREVGTPGELIQAAEHLAPLLEGRIPGCYVHPTATPSGALVRCVLGPGAAPHSAIRDRDALWFKDGATQVRLRL